ncbi:MAG TPA: PEP/pyruvate-binding domain-containing protein [Anaeromyxobacteraceae bacterium]|nr:PEP/pyruvate-binding domain-containing protein [Anaeromyxobacteraceae bacterium]
MAGDELRAHTARVGGAQDFQDLMRHRVGNILLVASRYDCFILEEDGQLNERMIGEYIELGLWQTPGLTRVASGAEAIARALEERRYNLIIASPHLGDMSVIELAREVRARGLDLPVVLLAFDGRELQAFLAKSDLSLIDRVFLWQGDVRILLAIVHYIEDKWNAPYDSGTAGVPLLLLVEDSIRYYSSFLPIIYTELVRHSQRVLSEGANLSQKFLRMRARPKVLLATTFEEAWDIAQRYRDSLLGLISDVEFPVGGAAREDAGVTLARRVRELEPDVPIVLQSWRRANERLAREVGADFLLKGSQLLLNDLRRCMVDAFGFGDFVFRLPDHREVGRASDLRTLERALHTAPTESIIFHAERNHFSKWLRARADFRIAEKLRPRQVQSYPHPEMVRQDLIRSLAEYRGEQRKAIVADFAREAFDGSPGFFRLGGGSLGGKARGLAFVRRLLAESGLDRKFPGVRVQVPAALVVGTDVFDQFLDENYLRDFVINCRDDSEIRTRVMGASFPEEAKKSLRAYLEKVRYPLAVRSSSLLEDSQHQPFSGVYETYMLANGHPDLEIRLDAVLRAIKGVYLSTFTEHAKAYLAATPYRLEEEKMAVILQRMVGSPRGDRFYPDVSGVARSYNFYPRPPARSEDGIVAVALGLGRMVVGGGNCLRFCPRYPKHLLSSVGDMLEGSQREFWALELKEGRLGMNPDEEMREVKFNLAVAERDGALGMLASTYSKDNGAVYDSLSRPGVRLVTFAPMLKHGLFPLADLCRDVLATASEALNKPVEIEFAVNLRANLGEPREMGFLQLRPFVASLDGEEAEIGEVARDELVCRSNNVLGHGEPEGLKDLLVVEAHRFERAKSRQAAREVAQFNAALVASGTPYVLVGVGRWGSLDPWLGIPVTWDQIAGARVIVEAGFRDFKVTPSQGSHFFQNVTSFQIGYFTVDENEQGAWLDWDWLAAQPSADETEFVRHLRLDRPLRVRMNGRKREGIILKPG